MRLSILALLLTGVSVASLVAAEPIRVANANANANLKLGHTLVNTNVNGNDDNVAHVVRPTLVVVDVTPKVNGKGLFRHICKASLRENALRLVNALRNALGQPPIENPGVAKHDGAHSLPTPFSASYDILRTQEDLVEEEKPRKNHLVDERPGSPDDGGDHEHPPHGRHGHYKRPGHHGRHRKYLKCFSKRIRKAIKALGPWEGRAVAFVLGCGIGVLLRMFWVLAVLAYRTVRGERGEETLDCEYIMYEQLPETLFTAPPEYVDEKVKLEAHGDVEEPK